METIATRWRERPCFRSVSFVTDMRLRDRFRSLELIDEWNASYPWLFDERDLEILKNPGNGHQVTRGFAEYLSAVLLFHSTGWRSLVRNYEAKSHAKKSSLFLKIAGKEVFDLVHAKGGAPDLFVFGPEAETNGEWLFAEVKGPGDRIHDNQVEVAERIFSLIKKPVLVIELVEI